MIYYTTIAYNREYQEISLNLINSFNKNTTDSKLVVVTDDVSFYEQYLNDNITAVKGPECIGQFKANLKYASLEALLGVVDIGDYVVFMDADCYFDGKILDTYFNKIQNGLSVQLGARPDDTRYPSQLDSLLHRDKILALNSDVNQKYCTFREACLIFKVDDLFVKFVKEWKNVFVEVEAKQLTHAGETFEIQIVAFRTGISVNNLYKTPFVSIIKTKERNGAINNVLA